jgi:hypothetical protein
MKKLNNNGTPQQKNPSTTKNSKRKEKRRGEFIFQ